ncbi:MAG: pyrroline-5-carboxylate reductase [Candidatus Bathyarchaeota archaeon]|nr:pyrroline-5-carboxylate reductase [Candidatus Bathyarchaeota archaeon]
MREQRRVAIVGVGKMGEAIVAGLISSKRYTNEDILCYDISPERREYMRNMYGVRCLDKPSEDMREASIVFIAVKPRDMSEALSSISSYLDKTSILVSVAAGVPLSYLRRHIPRPIPIVRIMPNLACMISESMIAYSTEYDIDSKVEKNIVSILSLLGRVVKIDEQYMDAATALIGSGPAYVAFVIEALADAGVRLGIPKNLALIMAAQTVLGASKLILDRNIHPAMLRDMVATPGGTTVEGLLILEEKAVKSAFIHAISRAATKASELRIQS